MSNYLVVFEREEDGEGVFKGDRFYTSFESEEAFRNEAHPGLKVVKGGIMDKEAQGICFESICRDLPNIWRRSIHDQDCIKSVLSMFLGTNRR